MKIITAFYRYEIIRLEVEERPDCFFINEFVPTGIFVSIPVQVTSEYFGYIDAGKPFEKEVRKALAPLCDLREDDEFIIDDLANFTDGVDILYFHHKNGKPFIRLNYTGEWNEKLGKFEM